MGVLINRKTTLGLQAAGSPQTHILLPEVDWRRGVKIGLGERWNGDGTFSPGPWHGPTVTGAPILDALRALPE